jgi:hypothetical protein
MIGLTFQNMGLIARQRTLVMPALLMVAAGTMPTVSRRVNRVRKTWATSAMAAPVSG